MKYQQIYSPERFELRDCYWEFHSVRDEEMTVRVDDVHIRSGEDQGEIIDTAVVTFRGFHRTWTERFENTEGIRISLEEAEALLKDGPYLVFSYWCDGHECELSGLGGEVFAMLFSFDFAEIAWDSFKQGPVGTLIRI